MILDCEPDGSDKIKPIPFHGADVSVMVFILPSARDRKSVV